MEGFAVQSSPALPVAPAVQESKNKNKKKSKSGKAKKAASAGNDSKVGVHPLDAVLCVRLAHVKLSWGHHVACIPISIETLFYMQNGLTRACPSHTPIHTLIS